MKNLHITVKDKIAKYNSRDGVIVCNNQDYRLIFTFDGEWDNHEYKMARFIWNGKYYDELIVNNECAVPAINDATEVTVGVYAGGLVTTTPAEIPCLKSILCFDPQLTDGGLKEYRDQAIQAAEEARRYYESMRSIVKIEKTDTQGLIDIYDIIYTDGTKDTFNVVNGASAEGGLTATQAEMLNEIFKWYKGTEYTPMTGTFTATPSNTTFEVGSSHSVDFNWTFTKLPRLVRFSVDRTNDSGTKNILTEEQALATEGEKLGIGLIGNGYVTYKCSLYAEYYDKDTGKTDKVNKSITFNFYNKYYLGYKPQPTTVDSDFITDTKGLVASKLITQGRAYSFEAKCPADCYVWYAYPTRYGKASPKSNNIPGGFESPLEVPVKNQYGDDETYYVYRSSRMGIGIVDGVMVGCPIKFE